MLAVVLILGFLLRGINLNQSLWLDEATQVILSSTSVKNIILQRGADFHPPLSYILLHFWMYFGTGEIWLRLLSVIFGVLTIYVTYLIAKNLFNKNIGIVSAFLFSIAPYHIYYSQEVRMYAEVAFFATVSVYFFYELIKKDSLKNYSGYILASLALIYIHYEGIFLLVAQLSFLMILRKDQLVKFLKALSLIFLLYLPWLPQLFAQLKLGGNIDQYLPGWRDVLSLPYLNAIPLTLLKFSIGRISFENQIIYGLVAFIVLALLVIILFKSVNKLEKNSKFILFWFAVPIILSFVISFKIPINQPFRILFVLPAFYILLSLGIQSFGKLKKFFMVAWIAISLFGLTIYFTNPNFLREDWKGASKFIDERLTDKTAVLFAWPEPFPPYQWYNKKREAQGLVKNFPAKFEEVEQNLKISDKNNIFFFEYLQSLSDPNRYIQKLIDKNGFKLNQTYDFRGVGFIHFYSK